MAGGKKPNKKQSRTAYMLSFLFIDAITVSYYSNGITVNHIWRDSTPSFTKVHSSDLFFHWLLLLIDRCFIRFPLYSRWVDRNRFEYAVFLLNRDLEQLLNSQNLAIITLRHTLPNLHTLLTKGEERQLCLLNPLVFWSLFQTNRTRWQCQFKVCVITLQRHKSIGRGQ